MRRATLVFLTALMLPAAAGAQENPLSAHQQMLFTGLKAFLIRSAEKMPEEHYGFRPVETVRTYGEIVAHIADWQYNYCSVTLGEKNPMPKIAQTKTTKADLVAALKDALAYCDRAFSALTDVSAGEVLNFHGMKMPRLGILTIDLVHGTEHYGNLVTYMRMKGIVPPSSEPGFNPVPKK